LWPLENPEKQIFLTQRLALTIDYLSEPINEEINWRKILIPSSKE
jgi:hypothetical protein